MRWNRRKPERCSTPTFSKRPKSFEPLCHIYTPGEKGRSSVSEALHAELQPLGFHVTIFELCSFRTNLFAGNSLQRAERILEFRAATAGQTRVVMDTRDGQQPDDPTLATNAIFVISEVEHPPLRFILGADALWLVRAKLKQVSADLDRWKATSIRAA
jgi:hypothetical protein